MTVVTLSMEVELAWGVHDLPEDRVSPGRRAESAFLDRLLARCDETRVPFSFDVVGHLFEDDCEGNHDGPHPESWFGADPGTDQSTDPGFYAPDMIDAIAAAVVDHEICTHSYSHIDCNRVDAEAVARDLELAQEVNEQRFGERTVSFVPPRHYTPPADALHEAGIEIVRLARSPPDRTPVGTFADHLVGTYDSIPLEYRDGVVYTYCSKRPSLISSLLPKGYEETHPALRYLPLPESVRQRHHFGTLVRSVEAAIEAGEPLHLWCHLNDMSTEEQWVGIASFLDWLGRAQDDGRVEVLTMAELNERARDGRLPVELTGEEETDEPSVSGSKAEPGAADETGVPAPTTATDEGPGR